MKKLFKIIVSVFKKMVSLYLIAALIILAILVVPEISNNISSQREFVEFIVTNILMSLLISFFLISFFCGPFVSYYFMIKLGNNVVDTIEESEHKIIDNNIYYRDVPKDYNPAIASLILNKWFERKTDITAMILYLIKRSYLKKDGDRIFYTGKNASNLSGSERYIVECYSQSKYSFEFDRWKDIVIQEAKDKGYVESHNGISFENRKNIIFKTVVVLAVSIILLSLFNQTYAAEMIFSLLTSLIPFATVVILIVAFRRSQINIKLTKKGIEEQEKLVKLRKFLSEFSLLEKSDETSMILWEDYLIYAVSLGVNTDIIEKSNIYKEMNLGTFNINQQLVHELSQKL